MICDFCENRNAGSRSLVMGTNEILLELKTFFIPIKNLGTETSEYGVDWY